MKVKRKDICQTCRQGKIGCDGKKPACSQCVLRGRQCPGYQSDWTFVAQGYTADGQRRERGPVPSAGAAVGDHLLQLDLKEGPGLEGGASLAVSRPLTSPLDHLMTFVVRSFVPDSSQDSSGAGGVPPPRVCGAWVEVLPVLASSGNNKALSSAINAFAAAVMSGGAGSTTMVSSARGAYSQALSALRSELRSTPKAKALPSQIIASIMCLLLAELFHPTTLGSWMAHLHGFGQSMQLARPEFYASGIPHKLFVGVRPILIVFGFVMRKATFLATEEWERVPFAETPASSMQKLMGVASAIPAILETLDGIGTAPRERAVVVAEIALQQLVDSIRCLERWKATSQSSHTPSFGCTVIGDGDLPRLWFPTITDANEATHFWAFNVVCLTTIKEVTIAYPELEFDFQCLAPWTTEDNIFRETVKLSRWICQSMEYLMQGEMRLFGMSSILLPLRVAFDVFRAGGRETEGELAFCRSILTRTVAMGHHFVPMFFEPF